MSLFAGRRVRWNPGGEQEWGEWGVIGTTRPCWEVWTESSRGDDGLPVGGGWRPVSGAALWGGPQQVGDAFHGGYLKPGRFSTQYEALKAAGEWNVNDPGSHAARYIASIAARSPYGLADALGRLGIPASKWIEALVEGGYDRQKATRLAHDAWNQARRVQAARNKKR
jgi:hypothetical protein